MHPLIDRKAILQSLPAVLKGMLGRPVPLRVTHCITYRCNLDCSYCARHSSDADELSTDEVRGLMQTLKHLGTHFWSFNGGEALVRDDLADLVGCGKHLGLVVSVATNGILVADRIDDLRDIDMVSVSIDGPRSVQDGARGTSYDAIILGLDAMAKAGIRFNLFAAVGSHNIGTLGHLLDLADNYGSRVFFQPMRLQKEDALGKSRSYFPEVDDMKMAMQYLVDEKGRGRPVASSYAYLDLISRCWPRGMPDVDCFAGRLYCFITPDGHVTQCCDTLTAASDHPSCNLNRHGARAFAGIPKCRCTTCYSSIPLEANILLTSLRKNPWAYIGRVVTGINL
jgi:MoaA/NifB/PqqE/SkfB family radical SAM enzyme